MQLTSKRLRGPDGLLSSRQGALIAALVSAIIAAAIFIVAISSYRHNVNASNTQSTVFVAKALIQKGTAGGAVASQGLASSSSVLQKQVASGAVVDTAVLRGKIATRDILPGEQLTLADFGAASGIAASLAPNQRAMSVSLDSSHGLTGVVQAGDHVDVYVGFNIDLGNSKPRPVYRLLIANVPVLQAAGSGGGIGGGQQNSNVLLNVNDAQAGALAFAADNGKIYLALRPGNGSATPPTFEDLGSVLIGSTPVQNAITNRQILQLVARAQQ